MCSIAGLLATIGCAQGKAPDCASEAGYHATGGVFHPASSRTMLFGCEDKTMKRTFYLEGATISKPGRAPSGRTVSNFSPYALSFGCSAHTLRTLSALLSPLVCSVLSPLVCLQSNCALALRTGDIMGPVGVQGVDNRLMALFSPGSREAPHESWYKGALLPLSPFLPVLFPGLLGRGNRTG
jgi:hypothetical protein